MGRNENRKYQRNCAFSFKRKRTAWNKRKDISMTFDTQVNLTESDKGFFCNQEEWLEQYQYGKGMFYSEYSDDKNCTSSEDNDREWEESSSEEDESSDSNTEELLVEDKNIVVSVSVLERLICSSTVCNYCHESVSLIEDQKYSAVSKKVQNTMHQHKLPA